ncbi:hypothetical protein [Polynucleobacter sp. MWH-Svant-W18]|uniref:hypothetical protein n=1 Tax=Polynucleobacter sp. MWH-Svant-W18 TaxID=1855909 RepID=UPI001BFE5258|nr:hypothetical protein [Polynucleobacter sp. MWH-Svant-W18]QWD78491.1 hypothetical protein C2757_02780 [Polynucleobacter sp. MWH-Svant-W18]
MGFFDEFGTPSDIKPNKKLGTKEMLTNGIKDQLALLNGEEVLNNKGELIRSWFRDGRFMPTVGIFGLFDGKALSFKKGGEIAMLEKFQKAFEAGEFDKMVSVVDKKRQANAEKLTQARAKKK